LVGLYATLQGVSSLLDMGLSGALSRELARLSVHREKAQEMRDLVRTLALFCWAVAAVLGVAVVLLASAIAHHWVNLYMPQIPGERGDTVVLPATPFGFYSGGLWDFTVGSCSMPSCRRLRFAGAVSFCGWFHPMRHFSAADGRQPVSNPAHRLLCAAASADGSVSG
jgi:hypothetical protein